MLRKIYIAALVFVFLLFVVESVSFAEFREIEFGRYYRDANPRELSPIEWLIIAENDEGVLLLTKKCIYEIPYNEKKRKCHVGKLFSEKMAER